MPMMTGMAIMLPPDTPPAQAERLAGVIDAAGVGALLGLLDTAAALAGAGKPPGYTPAPVVPPAPAERGKAVAPSELAAAELPVPDGVCAGVTLRGLPCRRVAVTDGFCAYHKGKAGAVNGNAGAPAPGGVWQGDVYPGGTAVLAPPEDAPGAPPDMRLSEWATAQRADVPAVALVDDAPAPMPAECGKCGAGAATLAAVREDGEIAALCRACGWRGNLDT